MLEILRQRGLWLSRRKASRLLGLLLFLLAAHQCLVSLVPVSWREADLSHVVTVVTAAQRFPLAEMTPSRRLSVLEKVFKTRNTNNSSKTLRLSSEKAANIMDVTEIVGGFKWLPRSEFYPEFFRRVEALRSRPLSDLRAREEARVLNAFSPILTSHEKSQLLLAFDVFSHICDAAGVTYFLLEASLMGVRRHHGMIPWDDDIDIVVDAAQWRLLHAVLSAVPGFELFASSDAQWKFYVSSSLVFPDKPFKFPYLDIFFFERDDRYVWAVTQGLKHDLVHRTGDIFPLLRRPFEGRLVPVPNNLQLLVDDSHDVTECVTGEYNHKTNEVFFYSGKVKVPCDTFLVDVFPFVERQRQGPGLVKETLTIRGKPGREAMVVEEVDSSLKAKMKL